MSDVITIAVVDDHPIVREGLVHVIADDDMFRVVAQGATADDAVRIALSPDLDILILDLSIPGGGLSALARIAGKGITSKVIVLTVSEDAEDAREAFRLGASGYVLKGISGSNLLQALRTIHYDGAYVSPELGAKLLAAPATTGGSRAGGLSDREGRICDLVRQGYSNKEIGFKLDLSEKTVKYYMTKIFRKLNVRNRLELAIRGGPEESD